MHHERNEEPQRGSSKTGSRMGRGFFKQNIRLRNVPHPPHTLAVKQLLSLALDLIEAQTAMAQPVAAPSLHRQLVECEPACRTACFSIRPEQPIEILGPAGTYPLAIGLALLAVGSGKPWGFIAQPWTWTDEDWRKVTDAVTMLNQRSILYRTGFKRVGIAFQLAA